MADDNADMRDYLRRLLGDRYAVMAVADGATALTAAQVTPPDLVLADVMMPGLDGFGLLRALRADPRTRETPVLLLSARAGEEATVEGLAAGADDYLVKPFSAGELLARVGASLELARLRRQAHAADEAALRAREAHFRALADTAPVMLWMTAPDGTCTYLNRRWYEFTGQTPATGLGLGWLDATHPEDAARIGELFLAANEQRAPFSLEYRLRCRDGEYRWAIDTGRPRFDDSGQFLGFIGAVIDIHGRKAAEAERERLLAGEQAARAEAEAAVRARDEFLSIAAHELRTPVTGIHGFAQRLGQLLERGTLDAERLGRAVNMIGQASARLTTLTAALLDVARLQTGRLPLDRGPLDLAVLTLAAAERCREGLDSRYRLLVEVPPTAPTSADAARLEQVFENLLSNAVKYSPSGGMVAMRLAPEGEGWRLSVSDEGIGLPEGAADRIFEPFGRVANAGAANLPGMGLGLHICRGIIERHGGRIWAESAGEGQGTTIGVWLPAGGRQ